MEKSDVIFGLTGLLFLTFYIIRLKKREDYLKNGIKTKGIVVDLILSTHGNHQRRNYYPLVEFRLTNGTWVSERYSDGTYPASFKIGEEVEIVYIEVRPNDYIILSKNKHADLIFLMIGVFAILCFVYDFIK